MGALFRIAIRAILHAQHRQGATMTEEQVKKVKRRIVDYLHKYATIEQLLKIAAMIGVKTED